MPPSKNGDRAGAAEGLEFVGIPDDRRVQQFLETDDPCFARGYSSSADACRSCRAPVIHNGRLYLLRDICEARCAGGDDPGKLRRLTSREVLHLLEVGWTVPEIYRHILADADPEVKAQEARRLLYNRLRYVEKSYGVPTPDIPPTAEMLDAG